MTLRDRIFGWLFGLAVGLGWGGLVIGSLP